jgi:hypothetical protein
VPSMTLLHKEFLVYCADDWSVPWILIKYVRLNDPEANDKTIQARTLAILRDLLDVEYIRAGDLVDFKNDTFIPWNLSVDQIIDRIRLEWDALGRDPKPWEIVWFTSTLEGDRALAEGAARNTLSDSAEEKKEDDC